MTNSQSRFIMHIILHSRLMISKWILPLQSYRKNIIVKSIRIQRGKRRRRNTLIEKKINLQTNQSSESYEACKHIKRKQPRVGTSTNEEITSFFVICIHCILCCSFCFISKRTEINMRRRYNDTEYHYFCTNNFIVRPKIYERAEDAFYFLSELYHRTG